MLPTQFVLYFQHTGESTQSRAAVTEAVNVISWVQRMARQEVSHNGLVKTILEGLQRQLVRPKKKEPVTVKMLQELVESMGEAPGLADIRLATICLLAFAGFLRFREVPKSDVVMSPLPLVRWCLPLPLVRQISRDKGTGF